MTGKLLALALLAFGPSAAAQIQVPNMQQYKNGCGAAAVTMVLAYWRPENNPSHAAVYQQLIDAERKGILLSDMKAYLEAQGFRAFTFRANSSDLTAHINKGRPLIVPVRPSARSRTHFIVLTAIDDTHVTFNDPTKTAPQRWPLRKFLKQWQEAEQWLLLATPASS
jgi:predicted double-glycine peptidase